MNCIYHIQNPVSFICIATHKCELDRKMCVECQKEHGVDQQQTLPLKKFEEIVKNNFKEFQLDDTSELTKERMKCKSMLSQTESSIKNVLDEISKLFKQTFDRIEQESKSFTNLINDNPNLASISNIELNELVEILQGNILNKFTNQKKLYLDRLERSRFWWEQEVKDFGERLTTVMNEFIQYFSVKPVSLDADHKLVLEKNLLIQELKELKNQMICQEMELDILKFGDTNITLNVKSFSTNLSSTFQMQLKDSVSDLYIKAVQHGIHKGSPQDCCLLVPSKNIKYALTEWNRKLYEIFIPNDYTNKIIKVEFSQSR
ncbi:unnamed protein product [Paramecium octaurelia]|uniref:Uncharacterized protein n=1 Tax=Paramecium octaurelia TaxID=43137 RepID=A0A8S1UYA9_PAROT|nr:unnamed protein product [Paramecium octaurelia]